MTPPDGPASAPSGSSGPAAGSERLWPAWWIWPVVLLLAASLGLVAARAGGTAGVLVGVGAAVAMAVGLLVSTPRLEVTADSLQAGRARVPLALLTQVQPLDAEQMLRARGVQLDARAYLCLRGWIGTGLLVRLADPDDPTPYWLLSSRRPEQLAAALRAGIERARSTG